MNFKKKYYVAPNIVVAACGDLEHSKLVNLSKRLFANQESSRSNFSFQKVDITQQRPQVRIILKDTEQTHILIGLHGLKRGHSDRHALNLLHVILGANMSSRLFHEVREKRGLAYEIASHVKKLYDTGAFVVHAGTDSKKVVETAKVILNQLSKIKKTVPREAELNRAKEYYIGQLTMALEDTLDHMSWIGESSTALNRTYTFNQILSEVKKIKVNDLLRLANSLFRDDKLNLAVVGPLEEKSKREIKNIVSLN